MFSLDIGLKADCDNHLEIVMICCSLGWLFFIVFTYSIYYANHCKQRTAYKKDGFHPYNIKL